MNAMDQLAAHFIGDFMLQTPRIATTKLSDPKVRAEHALHHALTHGVFAYIGGKSPQKALFYGLSIGVTHYIIDSKRWRVNEEWPPGTISSVVYCYASA